MEKSRQDVELVKRTRGDTRTARRPLKARQKDSSQGSCWLGAGVGSQDPKRKNLVGETKLDISVSPRGAVRLFSNHGSEVGILSSATIQATEGRWTLLSFKGHQW